MIWEIEVTKNEVLEPLFIDLESNLVLSAIVDGNSPAKIWVDNKCDPKSVFLWDKANNVFYLSGDVENLSFNNQIEQLLESQIIPEMMICERLNFRIRVSQDVWTQHFSHFFKNVDLIKKRYGFYSNQKPIELNWKRSIPLGFHIEPIDEYFLNESTSNIEFVIEEIQKMWTSIERFIKYGFGFSLVNKKEIACWCTAEYLSRGKCGVGIETITKYRNRGFATLTASAFIDYCMFKGIKPHWECSLCNHASRRVAEKIGLTKELEFTAYSGLL